MLWWLAGLKWHRALNCTCSWKLHHYNIVVRDFWNPIPVPDWVGPYLKRASCVVSGKCCACGYSEPEETECPKSEDGVHCDHWWDGHDEVGSSG